MNRHQRAEVEIENVCSWILRAGVVTSVSVMLCGLFLSFRGGSLSVAQMESQRFDSNLLRIIHGSLSGNGPDLLAAGVLLLVLTPILRVAGSMVLFATEERDWLYSAITGIVLMITLLSLLILK